LAVGYIQHVEKASWLSPIVVVSKKNSKHLCVDIRKLNITIKKDPYPLPFTNEIFNNVVGHETYSILSDF
jgi:hypothetical protein